MTKQIVLALLTGLILSACGQEKKGSIDEIVLEASKLARTANDQIYENSSGFKNASELPEEIASKFKVQYSGPKPSMSTRVNQINKNGDFKKVKDITSRFKEGSPSPKAVSCSSYNDPDPIGSQLLSTDYYTRQTPAVAQVANELSTLDKIFDYVKQEIGNSPNFGAAQSADTLIKTKSGSVVDKANLLVALLRAQKIQTQFVQGEIYLRLPVAKRFLNSSSISDIFLTLYQVYGGYFSNNGSLGSDYFQTFNGENFITIPHVWVRAFDGVQWRNFDPTKISDTLSVQRSQGLLQSTDKVDWSAWYFGQDSDGNYIKPKTVIDFLLESVKLNGNATFVNAIESYSGGGSLDGVFSERTPCVRDAVLGIENSGQEFRAEVVLTDSGGAQVLKVNQPLARLSEARSFLSHTAGLYSEISNPASGNVQFKIGQSVLGEFSANTGTLYTVNLNFYFPQNFSTNKFVVAQAKKYKAGGVFEANFFARPTTQSDLIEGIYDLKSDLESGKPSVIKMAGVHRLAGLLFHFRTAKDIGEIASLRSIRFLPISIVGTSTSDGTLVTSGQDKRELGFIPTQPGIDATILGSMVNSGLDQYGYSGMTDNLSSAVTEIIASGSDYEATIWEQLFGLRGYSAIRAFQQAASLQAQNPSNGYSFIQGPEFNSTDSTHISSQLANPSELRNRWYSYILPTYGKLGNFFWSPNKEVTDSETGTVVLAYAINGSDWAGAFFDILAYGSSFRSKVKGSDPSRTGDKESQSREISKKSWDFGALVGGIIKPFGGGGGNHGDAPLKTDQGKNLSTGPSSEGVSIPNSSSRCPVDYTTGLMWHNFVDLNLKGRTLNTGLLFKRTYYTLSQYQQSTNWVATGDLGKGWVHNFDSRLLDGTKDSNADLTMGNLSSSSTNVLWITDSGNTVLFTYSGGVYAGPAGFFGSLEVVGSTYVLTLKGNIKYTFKKDLSSNFNGRLLSIQDPHGESLTMSYDSNGRLQTVTSPFAGDLIFTRDGNNKVVSVKNTKNNLEVTFSFDSGLLSSSTDVDQQKTAYAYNTAQSGTAANGLLKSFTDPLGRTVSFDYYQNGRVLKEVAPGGAEQVYQYAPYLNERFTRVLGPNGGTTEFRYDSQFRVILETQPDGARIYRKWTTDGSLQWETDGLGNKTEFTYDNRGNRSGIKRPLSSNYLQMVYNQTFDKPTLITPLAGSPTQTTLNSVGDMTSVSRNLLFSQALSSNFTYDSFGTRLSVKTGMNIFSDLSDSDGFIKYEFHSRNPSTLKYDARGRVIQRKFTNGRILTFAYDNFDRVISSTDTHGPGFRNYFDKGGRMIKQERVAGSSVQTATFSYDDRDRLIAEVNYAGERTEYKYDIVGAGCQIQDKPVKVTKPDGKTTKFAYDEMGRKTKEEFPDGTYVLYGYNLRGDLISVMDALGNLMQYEYDANGRMVKTLNQSAGWQTNIPGSKVGYMPETTVFTYDQADRIKTKEMILNDELIANGRYVTEFQYNDLDRVIRKTITHKKGSSVIETFDDITYQYYPILEPTIVSQVASKYMVLNFKYETQPPYSMVSYSEEPTALGTGIGLVKHQYRVVPDQNGPMALLVRDAANTIAQTYDPAGRLLTTKGMFNGSNNTASMTYDSVGRRTGISHSSGLTGTFGFDEADRLISIAWSGSPSLTENLSYTKAGLIKQVARDFGTYDYGYTNRNEVASAVYTPTGGTSGTISLSYDVVGNISTIGSSTHQSLNNFKTQVGSNANRPSSDGLGRLQFRWDGTNVHDFRYYPEGQLKKFRVYNSSSVLQKTVDYYYDGLGRRIAKVVTVPSDDTTYLTYAHLGNEDKILSGTLKKGSASEEALYVDGQGIDDHLFEISNDTGVKTYKRDHLGSVLNSAAIGGVGAYGIYGKNEGTAVSTSSYTEPVTYGYTGREYENETGLYFYRARYYSTDGWFISKDPKGIDSGDANLYRYVLGNPLNFVDPVGLDAYIASRNGAAGSGIVGNHNFIVIEGDKGKIEVFSFGEKNGNMYGTLVRRPDLERIDTAKYVLGEVSLIKINAPDAVVRETAQGFSGGATYWVAGQNSNSAAQFIAETAQGSNLPVPNQSGTALGTVGARNQSGLGGACSKAGR